MLSHDVSFRVHVPVLASRRASPVGNGVPAASNQQYGCYKIFVTTIVTGEGNGRDRLTRVLAN